MVPFFRLTRKGLHFLMGQVRQAFHLIQEGFQIFLAACGNDLLEVVYNAPVELDQQ
jgi:hypothetical protein